MADKSQLTITDTARHGDILSQASDNGSLGSLLERIADLTFSKCVTLAPHPTRLEYSVLWFQEGKTEPFMVGGLIYFATHKEWSTHT